VNGRLRAVLIVLDILLDASIFVDREHVAIAGIVVKRVAIDTVGRLLSR
jgi:hypothetical protein